MILGLTLKLSSIFLGVLARTLVPYLHKLREGKVTGFQRGYLWSAIGSFILGFIITLLIFPQSLFFNLFPWSYLCLDP